MDLHCGRGYLGGGPHHPYQELPGLSWTPALTVLWGDWLRDILLPPGDSLQGKSGTITILASSRWDWGGWGELVGVR